MTSLLSSAWEGSKAFWNAANQIQEAQDAIKKFDQQVIAVASKSIISRQEIDQLRNLREVVKEKVRKATSLPLHIHKAFEATPLFLRKALNLEDYLNQFEAAKAGSLHIIERLQKKRVDRPPYKLAGDCFQGALMQHTATFLSPENSQDVVSVCKTARDGAITGLRAHVARPLEAFIRAFRELADKYPDYPEIQKILASLENVNFAPLKTAVNLAAARLAAKSICEEIAHILKALPLVVEDALLHHPTQKIPAPKLPYGEELPSGNDLYSLVELFRKIDEIRRNFEQGNPRTDEGESLEWIMYQLGARRNYSRALSLAQDLPGDLWKSLKPIAYFLALDGKIDKARKLLRTLPLSVNDSYLHLMSRIILTRMSRGDIPKKIQESGI